MERWPLGPLWVFGIKQAWAALFGGAMLVAILVTARWSPPGLARYDWLFLIALGIQAVMLATRLERPREVLTILVFHLTGLGMELFKTSAAIGSWAYPEPSLIRVGTVPLFSGFMYAAVGSYLARAWRVLDLRFTRFPPTWATVALGVAVYANFFTHHYVVDLRYLLFAASVAVYGRTTVFFTPHRREYRMPLVVGFVLIAFFIWVAENVATYGGAWLYPHQGAAWEMVGLGKLGAWYLLLIISFVLVTQLHRGQAAPTDGA